MILSHAKRRTLHRLVLSAGLGLLLPIASFGADLTIRDGTVVKFGADAGLVVRDVLRTEGQSTLTSIKDDAVAGQTGVATQTPAAGDWRGLAIEASATNLSLDQLTIRYGGASGEAGLRLRKLSPTFRFLSVDNSLIGVRVIDNAAPRFEGLSLFGNNIGFEVNGDAAPVIVGSDIHGNTAFGIRNLTPLTTIQAIGNWWGHVSGPKDFVGNLSGQGDIVSLGVNYGSFLNAVPLINPTVRIAGDITFTEQRDVTLLLSSRNAVEYRVAENGNFTGVPFQAMASSVPFTLSAADGLKQISAQYRGPAGNIVTASIPQAILYDTVGPQLAITNPAADSFINAPITIAATASDPAGVVRVEFYIDNALVATDTSAPYSYAWDVASVADGAHSIRVVAVDAVNHSTTQTRAITLAKAAPPPPDIEGPALVAFNLSGTAVTAGGTLTRSGTLGITASDRSGISRVDFYIDGTFIGTDSNGADGYSVFLDLYSVNDGNHTLRVRAFDSLNNTTDITTSILVALAPPAAPVISSPANNFQTNVTQLTVSGTAEKQTQVTLFNNGTAIAGPTAVDAAGRFSFAITTANGANRLQVQALNRGGAGPLSGEALVTVDLQVPEAPLGLNAVAQAVGKIRLTWNRSLDSKVTGYHLYRSAVVFQNIGEATRVTTTPIAAATTVFDDIPTTDGTYYYRVVAINSFGTASAPSNAVSAVSDNTMPKATEIVYTPTGRVDTATGRIAVGRVDVTVKVSEPLTAAPFLSIAPQSGVPLAVELTRNTDTEYRGSFNITPQTPSGTAFAVFSARDVVGNRGTEVLQGTSILIDAQGPMLSAIAVTPVVPIKNDSTSPASVTANLTLTEAAKSGEKPQLSFALSSSPATVTTITDITQTGTLAWRANFTLPAGAGSPQVENLSFTYRGVDDLDNVSTTISAANNFQVYQGELPPLLPPLDFAAVAQPAGRVQLSWRAVEAAVGYQLYRQAPNESALTMFQRVTNGTQYVDATSTDGAYRYAVAAIRQANSQESLSAQSNVVQVSADSQVPDAPTTLALALNGSGILATWQAPATGGVATYNLYRSGADTITTVEGLTPTKTGIKQLAAIDANPSLTDHAYVVTALDAAGNQSAPSNSVYLNFALLPVNNLTIVQDGNTLPVITWTHSGAGIAGYDVYLGPDNARSKLNLTPLSERAYTDTGFASDERRYTVVVFDNSSAEIGRSIVLPKLTATLAAGTPIKRGLMNRLQYHVSNQGSVAVSNARIKTKIGTRENVSEPFSIGAGENKLVSVVVGGFADVPSQVALSTTIEVIPNEGEKVQIVRVQNVAAQDGAMVLAVAPESLVRGAATGKVRFTLENTSDVETEILTATGNGSGVSGDIRYKILDKDSNVLATQSFKQSLGTNVITLANGLTVARLAPGASFTSDPVDLAVPASAPDSITVQLEIDRYHYQLGKPETVSIPGQSGRQLASLLDTAYYAEIANITPANSFGDRDVLITGRAIVRVTQAPMPNALVKLILNVNGFERKFDVFTDTSGNFTHVFKPTASDGGIYKVSALHPDMLERPVHGQFVINSLVLQYASYKLTNPRNFPFTIKVRATAGEGTTASNLRFTYQAADQLGGSLPSGVTVTPATPINLASKQSGDLAITVTGDNSAAETGSFVVKAYTDERGTESVGSLRVDFRFTDAKPALFASPSYIETGLAQGGTEAEQLTLENKGFSDAQGITATLLNTDGSPAPNWLYLMSGNNVGTLAVGEKRTLDIAIAPPANLAEGIYSYKLRLAAANTQGGDVPVYVSITQSGEGNALFKASDIYTATLDRNGNRIPGLAGARITLQNEQVISITQTLTTDSLGEAYFTNLPAGRYKFRATATNHQEVIGRITIKPGITATQDVFLDYNLVTVEWSVNEITIQDKYEILLKATFETDVPAAVIALEPASVTLPTMKVGDIFYGELTLSNYGLIRADNVNFTPPPGDGFFRFEFLKEAPTSLAAKQRVTLPYRVISLSSLDQPSGTGGGCGTWQQSASAGCTYTCANGTEARSGSGTSWYYVYGSCGGIPPAPSSTSSSSGTQGGQSADTRSSLGGGAPSYTPMPGAECVPGTPGCPCNICKGNNGGGGGDNGGSPNF
ncbi:MAG TPA: Ig-like domain-containing protein [Burkholderiales bacterium]|nr:Ig-like domain-containing protein [Burkholderiales bacterium]